jgi:TorA maturation chaperone TorD
MDTEIRYFFYDLFFSMFIKEPSDETISAWRKGLRVIYESQDDGEIGKSVNALLEILDCKGSEDSIRDEYYQLFFNPVDRSRISLLASYYVDGKVFDKYLVQVRTFLEKTPFRKVADYFESEDSLPFHFDLMKSLITEEANSSSGEQKIGWKGLQREFVIDYITKWIDKPITEIRNRESAPFYREAAPLMSLYFQEEREFLLGN